MYTLIKFCTYIILITRGNQKRKFSLRKITHPAVIWWFSGLIYARFTPAWENLCYPLKQSDSKLALSSLLTFAVNFHWLVMIFFFSSHWLYWLLRFGFKDTHLKCALIQLIVLGFCISTVIVHIFFLTCPLHFLNTKTKTKQKSTTN